MTRKYTIVQYTNLLDFKILNFSRLNLINDQLFLSWLQIKVLKKIIKLTEIPEIKSQRKEIENIEKEIQEEETQKENIKKELEDQDDELTDSFNKKRGIEKEEETQKENIETQRKEIENIEKEIKSQIKEIKVQKKEIENIEKDLTLDNPLNNIDKFNELKEENKKLLAEIIKERELLEKELKFVWDIYHEENVWLKEKYLEELGKSTVNNEEVQSLKNQLESLGKENEELTKSIEEISQQANATIKDLEQKLGSNDTKDAWTQTDFETDLEVGLDWKEIEKKLTELEKIQKEIKIKEEKLQTITQQFQNLNEENDKLSKLIELTQQEVDYHKNRHDKIKGELITAKGKLEKAYNIVGSKVVDKGKNNPNKNLLLYGLIGGIILIFFFLIWYFFFSE